MVRIVFSIISLVALAVIMVMNAGSLASFNLFGWQIEEMPVTVIALVSFAAGAVYSFIFYISSYLARSRRTKVVRERTRLKAKEKGLDKATRALSETSAHDSLPDRATTLAGQADGGSGREGSITHAGSAPAKTKRRFPLFGGRTQR